MPLRFISKVRAAAGSTTCTWTDYDIGGSLGVYDPGDVTCEAVIPVAVNEVSSSPRVRSC